MTTAITAVNSRGWRRRIFTSRNAAIVTLFDQLLFVAFGVAYLSPITPAPVWHAAGGAVSAAFVLPFAALAAVGGLIAARRPDNWVGWLISSAATFFGIGALCSLLGTVLLYHGDVAGRWVQLGGVFWTGTAAPAFLGYALAVLLFPDGHLPSRRWRWLVYAQLALVALNVFVALVNTNQGGLGITYIPIHGVDQTSPLAIPALTGFTDAVINDSTFVQFVLVAFAAASVFLRLRGADAERRQQIKWFAAGTVVLAAGLVATAVLPSPVSAGPAIFGLYVVVVLIAVLAVPVAVAVAMLRYRLYDIDIIISRALVYGVLAVLITGVYVGIAVGVGIFVGSGGKPNLGLSILATAIVALGFQPARERLQRVANRLVYGTRATPYEVLSEFSSQVAGSYAADEVLPRMARVLKEGTGAERSTVWLRSGGSLHAAVTWPPSTTAELEPELPMSNGRLPLLPGMTRAVEVRHQGELLGALSVEKRRGEALTPVEDKLLDDLAHQAGLVLKNVGLTADLQRRLEELRASRKRLVSAQDAERRRLERNLHDGAQQHLVAIKVKLGLAQMLAAKDPEKAKQTIAQLKADTDEALETLRDLARGIYPPLLAEKGLVTALESQARKATVVVEVDADGVGRYPQEVEATVYFCALEALQNVQKYAQASRAVVRLRDADGELCFVVEDDGRGFDVERARRGAGLTNMHDRLDAIGGALSIESAPGSGTVVRASIPAGRVVAV
ncbi:MAG TPA: sensor histidine kinase [Candidatus Dormibacteraeota bacterium]